MKKGRLSGSTLPLRVFAAAVLTAGIVAYFLGQPGHYVIAIIYVFVCIGFAGLGVHLIFRDALFGPAAWFIVAIPGSFSMGLPFIAALEQGSLRMFFAGVVIIIMEVVCFLFGMVLAAEYPQAFKHWR